MASQTYNLNTWAAKRIIGDSAAATDALLQTGSTNDSDTRILQRSNRTGSLYGINYKYDSSSGGTADKIELYGGYQITEDNETINIPTAWVQLDTGVIHLNNRNDWSNPPAFEIICANKLFKIRPSNQGEGIDIGYNWDNYDGAGISLRTSTSNSYPGQFTIWARRDSSHSYTLKGESGGTLTWTGNFIVTQAGGKENHIIARASGYSNSSNLDVKLMVGSEKQNHGVYSTGYSTDGTAFTSSAKWLIYRNSAGAIIVNGDCTGNAATVSRATFGDSSNGEHNANNIASNGLYYYTSNGPSKDGANQFTTTDGAIYCQAYNTTWVGQIAQDYRNGALAVRGKNNGTWSTWYSIPKMIVENYPALLPPNNVNNWIKIGTANTSYGLLPSQGGGAGSGHNYLGTSSWYWKYAYIDEIYGKLNGNCTGSSTSCTGNSATASKITDITTTDAASSSATWRRIWISYDNNATGRPAYTDKFTFQTSTGSMKTGRIHVWPADGSNSYNEGIRIHSSSGNWATLMLLAPGSNGDSGINTNDWGIFNNNGTLYINKGTSSGAGNPRVYANANGWYFTKAYGAVWNDFAEYRKVDIHEPGYAIAPSGARTSQRLESGARITSDTYGYAIGYMEDREDLMPVAIAGRVLTYPLHDKSYYEVGDAVCATEGGKIDKMTRDEIKEYPDRIIGIVNEIPDYDIWEPSREGGREPIHTNGRIWIDIK